MEKLKGCENYQYKPEIIREWNDKVTSKYTTLDRGQQQTSDKISRTERVKREQGEYVWRDDLKTRVHNTMAMSKSEDDFQESLKANGVDATRKTSKKYGEYFTYELMDTSNAPEGYKFPNRKLLGRSYKLGTAYGLDALRDILKAKAPEQPKPVKVEEKQAESEEKSKIEFADWCKSIGETFYDENDGLDVEKYESLRERYDAFLSGENESAEKITDEELETPYEVPTLAVLPNTDGNSKADAEELSVRMKLQNKLLCVRSRMLRKNSKGEAEW